MFLFHIAFALGLMAIASGFFLFGYAHKMESGLGKLFGVLIVIFALLSTICTAYYQVMLWTGGVYQHMMMIHEAMMAKDKAAMGDTGTVPAAAPKKHHK